MLRELSAIVARAVFGFLLTLSIITASSQISFAREFKIIDLGTLDGAGSTAAKINDAGQIVGTIYMGAPDYRDVAFIWENGVMSKIEEYPKQSHALDINEKGQVLLTAVGSLIDLGDFTVWEGGNSINLGSIAQHGSINGFINNAGQVVTSQYDYMGYGRAVIWENGAWTLLGTLNSNNSFAADVNDAGFVIGTNNGMYIRGFIKGRPYTLDHAMTDLGTLGGTWCIPRDVNNSNQVVGWSYNAAGQKRAFLWENGAMKDLGTLGGDESEAYAVNDKGQVVGMSYNASSQKRAFIWENGTMRDLGAPVDTVSNATAINESGQITGWLGVPDFYVDSYKYRHAFFWENEVLTDLGTLGGTESVPVDINNKGQVIGSSMTASGQTHAVLWGARKYLLNIYIEPAGSGIVKTSPESPDGYYDKSSVVTLTAEAAPHYTFIGWSGDASGTAPEVSITMDSNKSVTANFARLYRLTTNVSPVGGGNISVSPASLDGTYKDGTVVTLTATPAKGYVFTNWSGDASGADPVVNVTMNGDKLVSANFALHCAEASFTTGFCGKEKQGNAYVPVHVDLGGCNDFVTPVTLITKPDGNSITYVMERMAIGSDTWSLGYKLSKDMPIGTYRVEILRDGVVFDPPLACTFNYKPDESIENRKGK